MPNGAERLEPGPGKNVDDVREEVYRRHQEHIDKVRRENPPSTPVAPGGNGHD